MAVHPSVLWAQRSSDSDPSKNIIYLAIEVLDPINVKIDLTSTHLDFSATSADKSTEYALNLEFFDEIDPEASKKQESGNRINFVLRKKALKEEYWPRLLKEKLKLHYVKTDFDKWVDEDEQDELVEEENDMSNMMNFGGAGLGGNGPGGAGDIDFSQLLANGGGAGGPGGFDISSLASQLGQADAGAEDHEDTSDEE